MNQKQRLQLHEKIFHNLHFARLYESFKVGEYLDLIDAWSFASNGSNGVATEYEIRRRQDEILLKMGEL
jgi:hypothetical protein